LLFLPVLLLFPVGSTRSHSSRRISGLNSTATAVVPALQSIFCSRGGVQ
jgi:hypothetical protein